MKQNPLIPAETLFHGITPLNVQQTFSASVQSQGCKVYKEDRIMLSFFVISNLSFHIKYVS